MAFRTAALTVCATLAGCGGSASTSSAPVASPSPLPEPAAVPTTQTFSVDLPIAPGDSEANAYGIWPFGVHGEGRALDGHPGFDVEFRPGASVLAAAEGTVQTVAPDSNAEGRFTIRIDHAIGSSTRSASHPPVGGYPAPLVSSQAAVLRGLRHFDGARSVRQARW